MMRYGWLAAAAAMMCAVPAQAVTYINYRVMAEHAFSAFDSVTNTTVSYIRQATYSFTLADEPGSMAYRTADSAQPYDYTITQRTGGLTSERNGGFGGAAFAIDFQSVPTSQTAFLPFTATYDFRECGKGGCFATFDGRITSVAAYTTTIAPASNAVLETFIVSALGIPEPASWAMMILGVGAVGGMMRRRKLTTTLA